MIQNPHTAHAVHFIFEWLALVCGFALYRAIRQARGAQGVLSASAYPVILGCILGAGLGNKTVFWLENPHLFAQYGSDPVAWFMGQSIVGGLLGGWIGVEIGKKIAGETRRTGDDFVLPILLGILIGRIGCFLAGLHDGTYGIATNLPWGVDFGDGIPRHPTQLYEWLAAALAALTYPRWQRCFAHETGLAFRALMLGYLTWRFGMEFLKPVPYAYWLGLSGIQWVCALALSIIGIHSIRSRVKT